MHLDCVGLVVVAVGLVCSEGSIHFHLATSTSGSGNHGDYAEDKEEGAERPPEPGKPGMTPAHVVAHVVIAAISIARAVIIAV